MIEKLILKGIEISASDLHIQEDKELAYRVNGKLIRTNYIIKEKHIADFINFDTDLDLGRDFNQHRLRINTYMAGGKKALAIRIIDKSPKTIDELGLPQIFKDFGEYKNGLILFSGSAGSGKSTSLAAIIDHINKNYEKKIISLEDPIEYLHRDIRSFISQREIGRDVENYEIGIKSAMRQDPDIIMIGEIRDRESIKSALTLAETGHLVLATVHGRSVLDIASRIIDVFPPENRDMIRFQFAQNIRAMISQELVENKDKRIGICHVILSNHRVKTALLSDNPRARLEDAMRYDRELGSQNRDGALADLINRGLIELDYGLKLADDKEILLGLVVEKE